MSEKDIVKNLHPLETRVLLNFEKDAEISHAQVITRLSFNTGQYNQAVTWLESKKLIKQKFHEKRNIYSLTDIGRIYKVQGTPEERMIRLLRKEGPLTIPDITRKLGLEKSDIGSAFGSLLKESCVSMDKSKRIRIDIEELPRGCMILRNLLEKIPVDGELSDNEVSQDELVVLKSNSRKRGTSKGIFRVVERQTKIYGLTDAGMAAKSLLKKKGITGDEIGQVTPELLRNKTWKGKISDPII